MSKRPARNKKAKTAVKAAVKSTAKPKTFKTLKAAGRALKRNVKKPRPADARWPSEIKVGKRHRKDFGNLKDLAASIDARGGLLQPIAITPDNMLIAGQRRMKAWPLTRFKDDPIPARIIDVDSIIAGEWDENAKRKDFTPSEAAAISEEIERQLSSMARARERGGKKVDSKDKGRAADHAARATGLARRTIDKARAVVKAAKDNPKKFGKLQADMDRTGKVDGPFKRLQVMQQTEALRKAPPPLPMRGPYHAMVIDYPWPGEKDADQESIDRRGRAMRGYPEMAIEEGCKLFRSAAFQALLAPDVRVYFFVTNHHMDEAFVLLKAMGFDRHSTIGTWIKNKMGRGQVLRGKTEHCILAERGKPVTNINDADGKAFTTDWSGPGWEVREDSQKPDAFYDLVEQHTPAPRYAEIFSRGGRNEKWDCHGDQAGKFAPAIAKAAQEAILKEVQLSPDQQLLKVLEAVEKDETPDLRLVDKEVGKRLDELIAGKKKFKLTPRGKHVLADLRDDIKFAALVAELPDDPKALTEAYRDALRQRHDAVVADDSAKIAATDCRVEVIVSKWENGGKARVDLTERMGGRLSYSPRFEKLYRAVAAPVGTAPLWGQQGLFALDVDGLPCLAHVTHDLEITVYAVDADKPFLDEDGSMPLGWGFMDLTLDKEFRGKTVDQFIASEVRKAVKQMTPPKKTKPAKKGMPWPYLTPPMLVYSLPAEWDGKSEPPPVKAVAAKTAKSKSKAVTPAESAPVRRTLPGRDAELIAFAEACGHIVSRTIDHDNNAKVATCECGFRHAEPLTEGNGVDDVAARIAGNDRLDAAVTAHWQEAWDKSLITREKFADWLCLTAVQAGRDGGLGVGARIQDGLIKRKRNGHGYALTDLGEKALHELDTRIAATRPAPHPDAHRILHGQVFNEMPAADPSPVPGDQLEIPAFLRREQPQAPATSLTDPKLLPSEAAVKRIADRAEAASK